jgi:Eco29kI restriction endonuclease
VGRLLSQPCGPLPPSEEFPGVGIYAIYYHGSYSAYEFLARKNAEGCVVPIYVGKAVPKGGRKGGWGLGDHPGAPLFGRLQEHAESIRSTSTLHLTDFQERHLLVDDIWIPLAENLLIDRFQPLWNVVIDGFGNHDPGGPRYHGARPSWDALHPGRPWAEKCAPPKLSEEELRRRIGAYASSTI